VVVKVNVWAGVQQLLTAKTHYVTKRYTGPRAGYCEHGNGFH